MKTLLRFGALGVLITLPPLSAFTEEQTNTLKNFSKDFTEFRTWVQSASPDELSKNFEILMTQVDGAKYALTGIDKSLPKAKGTAKATLTTLKKRLSDDLSYMPKIIFEETTAIVEVPKTTTTTVKPSPKITTKMKDLLEQARANLRKVAAGDKAEEQQVDSLLKKIQDQKAKLQSVTTRIDGKETKIVKEKPAATTPPPVPERPAVIAPAVPPRTDLVPPAVPPRKDLPPTTPLPEFPGKDSKDGKQTPPPTQPLPEFSGKDTSATTPVVPPAPPLPSATKPEEKPNVTPAVTPESASPSTSATSSRPSSPSATDLIAQRDKLKSKGQQSATLDPDKARLAELKAKKGKTEDEKDELLTLLKTDTQKDIAQLEKDLEKPNADKAVINQKITSLRMILRRISTNPESFTEEEEDNAEWKD